MGMATVDPVQAAYQPAPDPDAEMRKKQQEEFDKLRRKQAEERTSGTYTALNQQRRQMSRQQGRASTLLTPGSGGGMSARGTLTGN
jgi:hypothetical protein